MSPTLAQYTDRLHRRRIRALLGGLLSGEKTTKETWFFLLAVHIQILVVVNLSWSKFPALWIGGGRWWFVRVQALRYDGHSLVAK
jgi:hypothetical protein